MVPTGERVTYSTLLAESKMLESRWEREELEQRQAAYQHHLQDIHDHQNDYWQQVDQAVARSSGAGYDEAVRLLIKLREAASQFQVNQEFQERFSTRVQSHLRRPAFVKRLQDRAFPLPEW